MGVILNPFTGELEVVKPTTGFLTKSLADTYYYPLFSNPAGYLTDAPSDGSTYGRKNGAWAVAGGGGSSLLTTTDIWVDSNRSDSYTEGGTIQYPFKSIQNACAYITTYLPGAPIALHLAPGAYSTAGDYSLPANQFYIYGEGSALVLGAAASNTLTIPGPFLIDGLTIEGSINSTYASFPPFSYFNNSELFGNLTVSGYLSIVNSIVLGFVTGTNSLMTINPGALVSITATNIGAPGAYSRILNQGTLYITDVDIFTNDGSNVAIDSHYTGSVIDLNFLTVSNLLAGGIWCDNGATISNPNTISSVYVTAPVSGIVCGSAVTYLDNYKIMSGANPAVASGTNIKSSYYGQITTSKLNLLAGTTTISPLNFTFGSLLTSPARGAMEFDTSRFYLTPSGTRYSIPLATAANTLLFTTSGATTLTLPTTGTLATTAQLGNYLPLSGGTMGGSILMNGYVLAGNGTLNMYARTGAGTLYIRADGTSIQLGQDGGSTILEAFPTGDVNIYGTLTAGNFGSTINMDGNYNDAINNVAYITGNVNAGGIFIQDQYVNNVINGQGGLVTIGSSSNVYINSGILSFKGPCGGSNMPTSDPADGNGTLWMDPGTRQVYVGT